MCSQKRACCSPDKLVFNERVHNAAASAHERVHLLQSILLPPTLMTCLPAA
jgi:hypothetical protein